MSRKVEVKSRCFPDLSALLIKRGLCTRPDAWRPQSFGTVQKSNHATEIPIFAMIDTLARHGRARPGHPRLYLMPRRKEDVDARDISAFTRVFRRAMRGHDDREALPLAYSTAARLAALANFLTTRSRLRREMWSMNKTPLR